MLTLNVVALFHGDAEYFRQYVKDIERYLQKLARLSDADIPRIVRVTCTGLVADYILSDPGYKFHGINCDIAPRPGPPPGLYWYL